MGLPRVTSLVLAALFFAAHSVAGSADAAPETITVGQLTLTLCNTDYTGCCGSITRLVDPTGVTPGTITVGFEYYPRSDLSQARLGTILPQEGGGGLLFDRFARFLSRDLRCIGMQLLLLSSQFKFN